MTCVKCGAEWKQINIDMKCPLCGESIVDDIPHKQAIDIMKTIIDRFGVEIYYEEKRFNGIINDMFPNALKEKNILRNTVSFGMSKIIADITNNPTERQSILKKASELSDANGMNEQWRNIALFILSYALQVDTRDLYPVDYSKPKSKLRLGNKIKTKNSPSEDNLIKSNSIDVLKQLSDDGDVEASFELAERYYNGNGVAQDYKTALIYYRRADASDSAEAQYSLGIMYSYAYGVEHDPNKAFAFYKKAADKGYIPAQIALGELYYFGQGCQKNDSEAIYWLEKADKDCSDANACILLATIYKDSNDALINSPEKAFGFVQKAIDAGSDVALNLMGTLYESGYYVDQDYEMAAHYYSRAAELGVEIAYMNIGAFYQFGYGVPKDEKKAVEYYQLGAKAGNMYCLNALGACYRNARGVAQDYKKAMELYLEAASAGSHAAEYNIGVAYENGEGVEKDIFEAKRWYSISANNGNGKAMAKLGIFAETGIPDGMVNIEEALEWYIQSANTGTVGWSQWIVGNCRSQGLMGSYIDKLEAFEWYLKAAHNGNATAQNNVACEYMNGIIVDQDFRLAVEWFEKAISQNDQYALDNYGKMLINGNGTSRDVKRGVMLLRQSAEQDNIDAMSNLGVCYFEGWGVQRDLENALYWLSKAFEAGDEQARYYLEKGYKCKNGRWQKKGIFEKIPAPEPLPPQADIAEPTEGCNDFCKFRVKINDCENKCFCKELDINVFIKRKCPYHHSLLEDMASALHNENQMS